MYTRRKKRERTDTFLHKYTQILLKLIENGMLFPAVIFLIGFSEMQWGAIGNNSGSVRNFSLFLFLFFSFKIRVNLLKTKKKKISRTIWLVTEKHDL